MPVDEAADIMKKDKAFWKAVANRSAQVLGSILVMAAAFFLAAGRLDLPRAWIFFSLYLVSVLFNTIIFLKFNPEVVAARGKIIKGEMKWWDKIFAVLYISSIFLISIVCGLDVGRFQLSNLGMEFLAVGIIMFIPGWLLVMWAMVENKFFEGAVRIQRERGHKVVSTGPYAIIRHPGYAGMILLYACTPLILGSVYGLIPVLLLVVAFVFRTDHEDKMLYEKLEGYKEYVEKVKYRLVPGIW